MSAPDEQRPRPQYGEYATPEEQRARIVDSGAAQHPSDPPSAPPDPEPAASAAPVDAHHLPSPRPTTTAARPTRTADRVITIALLAYGLITVLGAIPQLVDFVGLVEQSMRVAGIDATISDAAGGRAWGTAMAVVYAAGWLLTAVLSWWSLSHRRLSWWIPLVGAIVTFVIVFGLVMIAMLSDPGLVDAVVRGG